MSLNYLIEKILPFSQARSILIKAKSRKLIKCISLLKLNEKIQIKRSNCFKMADSSLIYTTSKKRTKIQKRCKEKILVLQV